MYFGKEVRVILKDQAEKSYLRLKKSSDKEAKSILNSFERIKEILKENPQYGDPIRKELIPSELKKSGIQNLYRAELSNYWRMLYTIEGNTITIFLFVLKIVDHKEYNKLFGYK
jgi:mRNA-degrading endonuclease RelE of RelBE toxin-antitoxin system